MSAIEPMDRITEIVQGAKARKDSAQRVLNAIEHELDNLRQSPRTAGLQIWLLGLQRTLKEEQAAAMHLIADAAALRSQAK